MGEFGGEDEFEFEGDIPGRARRERGPPRRTTSRTMGRHIHRTRRFEEIATAAGITDGKSAANGIEDRFALRRRRLPRSTTRSGYPR